jgi:hypothetical protein
MLTLVRSIVSVLACRFRSRADLELEVLARRRQTNVLRRQRPGRLRLSPIEAPSESTVETRTLAVSVTSRTVRRAGTGRKSRTATPQSYGLPTSADLYRVPPAEKANSRKLAVFALNQRDREFESTPVPAKNALPTKIGTGGGSQQRLRVMNRRVRRTVPSAAAA